ncbi:hypothetical protein DFH27DRAFT_601430 [Peziza echinospora]|nr:hypothetical protein DFH27DRAFT_601430 [Peziza echinospora]
MLHPIQILHPTAGGLLIAGIGGLLRVLDEKTGDVVAEWDVAASPAVNTITTTNNTTTTATKKRKVDEDVGVDVKKLKVDDTTKDGSSDAATGNVNTGTTTTTTTTTTSAKSGKKDKRPPGWKAPLNTTNNCVTHVASTRCGKGRWVVVATNEDKSVRVFEVVREDGGKVGLRLESVRQMPKRLCALRVVEEEEEDGVEDGGEGEGEGRKTNVVCADKFGDVYLIPLRYIAEEGANADAVEKVKEKEAEAEAKPKPSTPLEPTPIPTPKIAGGGIITTERNKKAAIKAQNAAMRDSLAKLESKELPFPNKLLLGHVSLLIDVIPATITTINSETNQNKKKKRRYVISADKDEHIRVSRYPDGHVIEGFCLGHTMYVSRLFIPSWDERTLVSGGGDGFLLRWDWVAGRRVQRMELGEYVRKVVEKLGKKGEVVMDVDGDVENGEKKEKEGEFQVCVTGITGFVGRGERRQVVVSVEGLPALFIYADRGEDGYHYTHTIGVSGNVLDVAVIGAQLWVTIDPQSTGYDSPTTTTTAASNRVVEILEAVEGSLDEFTNVTEKSELGERVNGALRVEAEKARIEALKEVFYGAKQLRKFENEHHTFGPEVDAEVERRRREEEAK